MIRSVRFPFASLSGPVLAALLLSGCAAAIPTPSTAPPPQRNPSDRTPPPARPAPPPTASFRTPQIQRAAGTEVVIEQGATALTQRFGTPRLDVTEGDMRKLQFAGQSCVLDVFLYPLRQGAEPVATYVEARRASDGQEVDRGSCIQALQRR